MDRLSDDRLTLVGLLVESTTALRAHLDRQLEQESGLPLQWFELLLRLARSPGRHLRMSDLAAQTSLTPSGLTRAIDRLEEAGLAERVPCPSDRRGSYAALTARGLERITTAVGPHLDHIDTHLTAALSADEQSQLADLLRKVRDHVNPAAAAAIPVGPISA
ncbi:MAG TPA: MarR family winged helix-turn-helix transcriptional regulator [Acidimicrobiales bacterium]|nr:MarR family winged helix-turn-helix transcriptional regulator [Acidimicrobiales bacterium]